MAGRSSSMVSLDFHRFLSQGNVIAASVRLEKVVGKHGIASIDPTANSVKFVVEANETSSLGLNGRIGGRPLPIEEPQLNGVRQSIPKKPALGETQDRQELARKPDVRPDEIENEKEDWEDLKKTLLENPQPSNRAKAAGSLGKVYKDEELMSQTVALLQKVCSEDPDPTVKISALRGLAKCGKQANSALPMLQKLVYGAGDDTLRRTAAESVLAIDRDSPVAWKILRAALTGSKARKVIAVQRKHNQQLNDAKKNRLWALEAIRKYTILDKRITTVLIDICEEEIEQMVKYNVPYDGVYFSKLLDALWLQGQSDERVLKHLEKYKKGTLEKSPRATQLRIEYDSLIKKLHQN